MSLDAQYFSNLKISDIRIYKLDLPLKQVFEIATMRLESANNVLIQIITNDGIEGWGEGAPFHALVGETQSIDFAVAKELREILLGKNPLHISSLIQSMDHYLPHNTTIKSAFDMALYDIAAKVAGLPLYLFLHGKKREIETDITIGICDPEEARDKALSYQSMGFSMYKVKLGQDFKADLARLISIRDTVGDDAILRIDANQGWDRMSAINNLSAYSDLDIEFCEQPCRADDLLGIKYVSDHSKIPIMADESLFSPGNAMELIKQDIVPYFNIKLSKSGGILNAIKISQIAEAGYIPSMVGCMSESKLGITAAAHFGLTSDIIEFYDLDSHLDHAEDPMKGGVEINNGKIEVPDDPGIGVTPDLDYLKNMVEIK
ncbi:mandelate racemase/muconate lactonizing enzyme family protein [Bacteroidota bacterium]